MVRYAGQILTSITVSPAFLCSPIMADVIPTADGSDAFGGGEGGGRGGGGSSSFSQGKKT